jgi:hypothetical protein
LARDRLDFGELVRTAEYRDADERWARRDPTPTERPSSSHLTWARGLDPEGPGSDSDTQVIGIVGSGYANLNPAVVTVTIHASEWGSRLVIRGAAKEGLIKQRAGAKAAKQVAAAMAPEVSDGQAD